MNSFEKFILAFAKNAAIVAPGIAPLFIHTQHGVAVFNASEALASAAFEAFPTSAPPAA